MKPGRSSDGRKSKIVSIVEVCALALLSLLAARFVLAVITPADDGGNPDAVAVLATSSSATSEDYSVLARYNPFSASTTTVSARDPDYIDAVETTLNISISGAMILEGGRGSAIIRVGSAAAKTYLVGDEIEPGVTLERLESRRAIISRNGVLESVTLDKANNASGAQQAGAPGRVTGATAPAGRNNSASMSLERLAEIFVLRPVRGANGIATGQYVVTAGADQSAFNRTGLSEGDVISRINGQTAPQNPERLFEMLDEMKNQDRIVLTINRGGEEIELPVILSELQ